MTYRKRKVLCVTGDFSETVKVFHSFGSKAFCTPTNEPAVVFKCSSLAALAAPGGAVVVEVGYRLVSCRDNAFHGWIIRVSTGLFRMCREPWPRWPSFEDSVVG